MCLHDNLCSKYGQWNVSTRSAGRRHEIVPVVFMYLVLKIELFLLLFMSDICMAEIEYNTRDLGGVEYGLQLLHGV